MPDIINARIREKKKGYEILISPGGREGLAAFLKGFRGRKCAVIADSRVARLYGKGVGSILDRAGIECKMIEFPPGEKSKTRREKGRIEDIMLSSGFGRDSFIIALGGGVTGDLAGFIAATFCRGIPYVQVPTSLIGMVDSSVGGKTGVDTRFGKNLIGAFHHPAFVFIDISCLKTLPEEEYVSGLAEVVKISFALDRSLFYYLEKYADRIAARDEDHLAYVIKRCVTLKEKVVRLDPEDAGLRQALNLGHTVGHAIESCSGYRISHGKAVSIGLAVESSLSCREGILEEHDRNRLVGLLGSFALPTKLPGDLDAGKLLKTMRLDKKAKGNQPMFVLPGPIGRVKHEGGTYAYKVSIEKVRAALEENMEK